MIIKRLTKEENRSISNYISDEIYNEKVNKDIKGIYLISFRDDNSLNNYIDIYFIIDNINTDRLVRKKEIENVIIRTYYSSKDNYSDNLNDIISIEYSYDLFNSIILKDTRDKYYSSIKNKFEELGYNKYGNNLEFTPSLNIKFKRKRINAVEAK